jgi:hypothetical protein
MLSYKPLTRRIVTMGATLGCLLTLAGTTSAQASYTGPQTHAASSLHLSETDPLAPKLNSSTEAEKARIEATGGEILASNSVGYHATGQDPLKSSLNSFPTGCALSVFIYKERNSVFSDSITTCVGVFVSSYMDSTMDKFDTFWGIWAGPVASRNGTRFNSHSYTSLYSYACPTSAPSGFRTTTEGGLNYNGEDYFAEAYDVTDGSVACG